MGAEHLTPWKKGQSGNPSGLSKIPNHLRGIASLTQHEVTKIVSKYARMTLTELEELAEARQAPALEAAIIAIFISSAKHGDYQRLAFLLDRAIGRIPVAIEDDADKVARRDLAQLTDRELIQLVKEKLPALELSNGESDPAAG